MAKVLERTEPTIRPRSRVRVAAPNVTGLTGKVLSVKWSGESGWWVEVDLDDGRGCWMGTEQYVTVIEEAVDDQTS